MEKRGSAFTPPPPKPHPNLTHRIRPETRSEFDTWSVFLTGSQAGGGAAAATATATAMPDGAHNGSDADADADDTFTQCGNLGFIFYLF